LASASSTAPRKASATPAQETANAYLPKGVAPAVNNWLAGGGDIANSGFSQLKQITSANVAGLKNVWNASFNIPSVTANPQSQPICCPNDMMIQVVRTGVVAVDPADGHTLWAYQGPQFNTVRAATNQVNAARSESWNPKLNYIYAGQQDGSVVALKATTGAPVWTAQVSGAGTYGSASGAESAPFTQYYDDGADGIVLACPNGGESPFRGHMDAYNSKTGALVWRSWTTPDPTQLPYILTWANPAEASQGGAAIWSIPAVDPELGLVYFGTGNLYPWTGRQPGKNLFGVADMAVDWKTGALRWYFQEMHHDIWDLDTPNPPNRINVPIDGKMTPVIAHGGKNGYLYVLNAKNGGPVPHFKIQEEKVRVSTTTNKAGQKIDGLTLNALWPTQPVVYGAASCIFPVDWTVAKLTACGFPADYLQIAYGGTAPNPGVQGSYGPNVQGANGKDVCPTCKLINVANGKPIIGTELGAAHTSAEYYVFGGAAGGGVMGYPRKAYNPITHNLYICARGQSGGHSNAGDNSTNAASVGTGSTDTRIIRGTFSAVHMTDNTMAWQIQGHSNDYGDCYSGAMTTAGNLAFTAFQGRNDLTAAQLLAQGIAPGGTFVAADATTGKILWKWGTPGVTFGGPAISYSYKGKQYIAIYHGIPGPTTLAGGVGSIPSGQRDQLSVFSL
jgi:hypothetical protein